MSYVDPAVRPALDALPERLRGRVLEMDVRLERPADLLGCLERLAAEGLRDPRKKFF